MRRVSMALALAALTLPGSALAAQFLEGPEFEKLMVEVPRQDWYPKDYYDVRISAELQLAEYPTNLDSVVPRWTDVDGKVYSDYDLMDCSFAWAISADADPVTARYGILALDIARIRSELVRLKFPPSVYGAPLLAYEKFSIEQLAETGVGEELRSAEEDFDPAKEPLNVLVAGIEDNRKRLPPQLPEVHAVARCGEGPP